MQYRDILYKMKNRPANPNNYKLYINRHILGIFF